MKLILLPLLISVGFIAYEHHDKLVDQYNAGYPSDPAKAAALDQCARENASFSRLDADDRKHCYRRHLAAPTAIASPSYAYSPSHLAGSDVRRQEANGDYLRAPH